MLVMKRIMTVLAIGTLCVLPAANAASAEPAGPLNIVAMGDSYGSGTGAGDYAPGTNGTCFRSANSYSQVIVNRLRERGSQVNFTNVTCSGAGISTLRDTFKGEPAQFDALKADTDLVFLSVGATDVDFAGYGLTCVLSDCSGRPTQTINEAMPRMGERLTGLLNDIKERSPKARIVLTGYGQQVTPGPNGSGRLDLLCGSTIFTAAERAQGGQVMRNIDRTLRQAAASAGEQGVDVRFVSPFADSERLHPSFEGRSLCEGDAPFYRGYDALSQEGAEAVLHLNRAGQAALADLVQDEVSLR